MKAPRRRRARRRVRGSVGRRVGIGSIITVRRRSLGAMKAGEVMVPILVGGAVTGVTIFAIKKWVSPMSSTGEFVNRYAPGVGLASGLVAATALAMMSGSGHGVAAGLASAAVAGSTLLYGMVSDEAAPTAALPVADEGAGVGAIVPEYSGRGMGAIAFERVNPRTGNRAGTLGGYGTTVALNGINSSAFGTPGFVAQG
jgi:hypothetical protein